MNEEKIIRLRNRIDELYQAKNPDYSLIGDLTIQISILKAEMETIEYYLKWRTQNKKSLRVK